MSNNIFHGKSNVSDEQAQSLKIEQETANSYYINDTVGAIGSAYNFSMAGEFDSAEISFEFDSDLLLDPDFDPVIYWFDEEEQELIPLTTTVTGNVASAEVEHFSTTLSIFQSQNIHGEQSNLNGAIDVALDHFSNGVTTSKFIVLLSDGLTGTPISSNVLQKAKNKGVKIFSFAIGNYSQGIANLKLLAYRTGGTYYGIGDYLHFASYYADLINIDIDSDSDGLPDYYESNIPIYNGNCIVTSPNIQDTDGDTLKDGEEIIIRKEYIPLTNNVRVYAKMLSDPRDEDTDGDGIHDNKDTDPLHKGMAGGIVGELSIVSFCDGKDLGHAFLVYKSLVHDYLDLTGFEYGFDVTINPQSEKLFSYSPPKIYEINSNEYVTFGAWADNAGQSLSYSYSDDIISLLGVHNTDGGIRFNQEAADIKNAHSAHDFCIDNYSVTNFVNENQLNILEPSLESVGKESSSRQGNRQPAAAKHDH